MPCMRRMPCGVDRTGMIHASDMGINCFWHPYVRYFWSGFSEIALSRWIPPNLWIWWRNKLWKFYYVREISAAFRFSCWISCIRTISLIPSGKMLPIVLQFPSLYPDTDWWLLSHCAPVIVPEWYCCCTWYIPTLIVWFRISVWTTRPGIWDWTPWCYLESVYRRNFCLRMFCWL